MELERIGTKGGDEFRGCGFRAVEAGKGRGFGFWRFYFGRRRIACALVECFAEIPMLIASF
jgi:hypothetical protein